MMNDTPTLIIAEAGINHNGSLALAKEMIEAAKEVGADVVKFQTYIAEQVMTDLTPLANYMSSDEKNFLQLAKRLELSYDQTRELFEYAHHKKIEFLSSPFDEKSCAFLGSLGLKRLKIPSGEAVNPFLLSTAAETKLPLIVSTGMMTLEEVKMSLEILEKNNSGPITLLHCTSQYPAEAKFCNLNAITSLKAEFGIPIGYSDHSQGIEISLAAVALGAAVIEKHFTLDKTLPGPDQASSLEPHEFSALVKGVRKIEKALGHGNKVPFPVELELAKVARKSIVTRRSLKKDEVIKYSSITAKRPGTGIPAIELEKILGRRLVRNVGPNHLIQWSDLN